MIEPRRVWCRVLDWLTTGTNLRILLCKGVNAHIYHEERKVVGHRADQWRASWSPAESPKGRSTRALNDRHQHFCQVHCAWAPPVLSSLGLGCAMVSNAYHMNIYIYTTVSFTVRSPAAFASTVGGPLVMCDLSGERGDDSPEPLMRVPFDRYRSPLHNFYPTAIPNLLENLDGPSLHALWRSVRFWRILWGREKKSSTTNFRNEMIQIINRFQILNHIKFFIIWEESWCVIKNVSINLLSVVHYALGLLFSRTRTRLVPSKDSNIYFDERILWRILLLFSLFFLMNQWNWRMKQLITN